MLNQSVPSDPAVHEAAIRTARKCRAVIEAVLSDGERPVADMEFYLVIREEMERLVVGSHQQATNQSTPTRP